MKEKVAGKGKERLVSIKKSDLESLKATLQTLQNEEVMKQLRESEKDIREGRVREMDKLLKEL